MIKKIKHWVHTSKHKYINGPKGVISIMLAILMLPFFSLAAILVESERYQSAVSLLDSAMGSSSLSVLANYDHNVYNRFGVMSVSQDADIQNLFSQYLKYNTSHTSGSVDLSNVTAQGKYAISDPRVLKQQLLEYSKLNAPLTLVDETLNLSELIKKLEGLTNLTDIFSTVKSAGKSVDSLQQLNADIHKLKEKASALDDLRKDYDNKFNSFSNSVTDLASALAKPRPEYKASEEEYNAEQAALVAATAAAYDKNIADLRQAAEKAKSEYYKYNDSTESALYEVRNQINAVMKDNADLGTNIASTAKSGISARPHRTSKKLESEISDLDKKISDSKDQNEIDALEKQKAACSTEKASVDAETQVIKSVNDGAGKLFSNTNETFSHYNDDNALEIIQAFHDQKEKVNSYSCASITKDTKSPPTDIYKKAGISGIPNAKEIGKAIEKLEDETVDGNMTILLKTLVETIQTLVKTEGIFDPQLSANIDTGYYNTAIGGLPTKTNTGIKDYFTAMLTDISNILVNGTKAVGDTVTIKIFSIIDDLVKLVHSIASFIDDLVHFLEQLANRIMELVSGNFDSLSLMTYFAYNLPNRTNYKDGSTMTGYKYSDIKYAESGLNTDQPLVELDKIVERLKGNYSGGKDYTFCGAELEYIFFGSNSEKTNQIGSFFAVYFMRFVLDAVPVSLNKEVQAMAKVPYVGPVLFLLELLGEPFVDAIILVNGESVPAVERNIYLTPSGFQDLADKLIKFKSKTLKDALTKSGTDIKDACDKGGIKSKDTPKDAPKKSLFEFKYDAHMLAIMMLLGNEDAYVTRFADLIEMETYSYYKHENFYKVYNIYKAYTYIDSTADVNFNQLLPIPSLSTNILFQTKRETFRGY